MSRIYNIKEAAMCLGVSDVTIRRLMKEGRLKGEIKSNKHGYKFDHDELVRYAKAYHKRFIDIDTNHSTDKLSLVEMFVLSRIDSLSKKITDEYIKHKKVDDEITAQYNLLLEIQEILKGTT